jgi:hypothetical protein
MRARNWAMRDLKVVIVPKRHGANRPPKIARTRGALAISAALDQFGWVLEAIRSDLEFSARKSVLTPTIKG